MPALQYNRRLAYFISTILFDAYEISLTTVFGGGWNEMRLHFVCSTVPSMCSVLRFFVFKKRKTFVDSYNNALLMSS